MGHNKVGYNEKMKDCSIVLGAAEASAMKKLEQEGSKGSLVEAEEGGGQATEFYKGSGIRAPNLDAPPEDFGVRRTFHPVLERGGKDATLGNSVKELNYEVKVHKKLHLQNFDIKPITLL